MFKKPPTRPRFAKPITYPPAKDAEQRKKQLEKGITPEYGRGASGGTSPLPHGAGWMPHQGRRQRLRSFTRSWNQFEKKCRKDDHYQVTRERLLDWIVESEQPDPELASMAIVHSALIRSIDHTAELAKKPLTTAVVEGTEWVDELNNALTELEKKGNFPEVEPVSPSEEV